MTTTTDPARERAGRGRLKAAWTLIVLVPLCAEAAFSGISTPFIWLALPALVPLYGGGVLLVRELARRTGAGWPGLLLLGFAFELAEDGVGLQDLTSTHLYTAASWGPRVLGLNLPFWEAQLGYHLVFSVLIPITLTEMMFRRHGRRPYLGTTGLIGTAVAFVAGIAMVRALISGTEDPGYVLSLPALGGFLAAIVVLGVLALVVVPRLGTVRLAPVASLPSPAKVAAFSAVAVLVFLGLIWPLGPNAGHPAVGTGAWVWLPMVLAAVVAVAAGRHVARWCATPGFGDHHRVWLIGGALVAHTLDATASGLVGGSSPITSLVIGVVVIAATVLLLRRLDQHVLQHDAADTYEGRCHPV
jgi:hypothetical protein